MEKLTNISIFVVCIWMICESSETRFGQMWPKPSFVCTCSLVSKRHNFGDSKQIRKNGSIHVWHGFIVAQSKPDNFIAVFLRGEKERTRYVNSHPTWLTSRNRAQIGKKLEFNLMNSPFLARVKRSNVRNVRILRFFKVLYLNMNIANNSTARSVW